MAVTTNFYETYFLYALTSVAGVRQINHGKDTFKILFMSGSYSFVNEHSTKAQVTANQIDVPNYVADGITLENVTYTIAASGTGTFDADDVIVTASGGDMSAASAIIYREGTGDPLLLQIDFGQTETAGDGTTFQITFNADGIVEAKEG